MPAEPDRRHDLIEAGTRLFLAKGYTATSVDAICREAGVTKGAFFHHFKSKDDFASEVLAETWNPVLIAHEPTDADTGPDEALVQHIRFMVTWICDRGRLMPMLANELGSSNPAIGSQIRSYFATWMGLLTSRIEAAGQKAGQPVDIDALKDFVVATTEGVPVARAQFGEQVVSNVADHLVSAVLAALSDSES